MAMVAVMLLDVRVGVWVLRLVVGMVDRVLALDVPGLLPRDGVVGHLLLASQRLSCPISLRTVSSV